MIDKLAAIDFEFFDSNNYEPHLVCCSLKYKDKMHEYWLLNKEDTKKLAKKLLKLHKLGYTFLAFMAIAEIRSILTFLPWKKVKEFKVVDLYCEWANLKNKNNKWDYGYRYVKGKLIHTTPKKRSKWEQLEEDYADTKHASADRSLVSFLYAILGYQYDTEFKVDTRAIILSRDIQLIELNKEVIQTYCNTDVEYLRPAYEALMKVYKKEYFSSDYKNIDKYMLLRGEYSLRSAKIDQHGYGVDLTSTVAFGKAVPSILAKCQRQINRYFPDIKPFRFDDKHFNYHWNKKATTEWVAKQGHKNWMLTEKGNLSLSLDAFKRYYPFNHEYPRDNFGAQMVRYLTLKQNIYGMIPPKTGENAGKSFFDSMGKDDNRMRPNLGIYGSQTGRNQQEARGFIFAKPAWMRVLVAPRKGKMLWGIDYSSEEFYIAALLSGDENMKQAYLSGDPYIALGIFFGALPKGATRDKYKQERKLFKRLTLALQYGMGAVTVAGALTEEMGRKFTEAEAQDLIDQYFEIYSEYEEYLRDVVRNYEDDGYIMQPDGWTLWGDNPNIRSVRNFPIQGFGGVILRKAVKYFQDSDIEVEMTQHDAIYFETDLNDFDTAIRADKLMKQAFRDCMSEVGVKLKENEDIRTGVEGWSPELDKSLFVGEQYDKEQSIDYNYKGVNFTLQLKHIDPRALEEYNDFSPYLEPVDEDDL